MVSYGEIQVHGCRNLVVCGLLLLSEHKRQGREQVQGLIKWFIVHQLK